MKARAQTLRLNISTCRFARCDPAIVRSARAFGRTHSSSNRGNLRFSPDSKRRRSQFQCAPRSCRPATITLKQPAEPLPTAYIAQRHDLLHDRDLPFRRSPASLRLFQRLVVKRLMRPFFVVMLQPLRHQVVEVPLTKNNEVVEALLLDRLDEPLHEGVRVRRPEGRFIDRDSAVLEIVRCQNENARSNASL